MTKTFKIFRYDPEKDKKPYFKSFAIEVKEGMTILDVLNKIKAEQDSTLTYRRSCRSGVCGSCAININGKNTLACYTQISTIRQKKITLRPLPGFEIIKDLVVNWEPFFDNIAKILPYLNSGNFPEKEFIQTPEERRNLTEPINCILCACCSSSCPMSWTNNEFLGPAAFLKAYRFIADSRDNKHKERLEKLNDELTGVWRCHTVYNCFNSCPKKIDLTYFITKLKHGVKP
ncbi:MAG: succinate dehydrogenase iron-sulfur subunit [Elusimicrobiota bacterium]